MAANAELQGRVGLDINPFMSALRTLGGAAQPAGAFIGKQFRSGFLRFFGAGAAIAIAQKSIRGAAETRREASKLDLDVETYQALDQISQKTGHSVDELTEKILRNKDASAQSKAELQAWIDEIKNAGAVIDAETIEKLAHLFDVFQQLFNRLAPVVAGAMTFIIRIFDTMTEALSDAIVGVQKIIGLVKSGDFAGLAKIFGKAAFGKAVPMAGMADIYDYITNLWKGTALPGKKPKEREIKLPAEQEKERQTLYRAQVDALKRVGIYTIGSPSQVMMGRQNVTLEKIEKRLIQINTSITGQLSD